MCACSRTAGSSSGGRSRRPAAARPLRAMFTVAPDARAHGLHARRAGGRRRADRRATTTHPCLVPPPGRRRRVLVLEGAPGFEHTFLTRAWSEDPSLDVDSVVRKGRNEQGDDTYFVQAAGARAEALAGGFPATREALYAYDAVVLANLDVRVLPRERLEWLRDFVCDRGGGLLMLGARSFDAQALAGTPIEELLPLRPAKAAASCASPRPGAEAGRVRADARGPAPPDDAHRRDRRGGRKPMGAAAGAGRARAARRAAAGRQRAGRRRWRAGRSSPWWPCSASARAGRSSSPGEASWRWKMMLPASDGSYDRFWRQAARWLTAEAADPVSLEQVTSAATGGDVLIAATVAGRGVRVRRRRPASASRSSAQMARSRNSRPR